MPVVSLVGNLTKEAQGNEQRTKFIVAENVGWGDNQKTLFYACTLWGKRGESLRKYLEKGTKVFVSGILDTYKTDEGETRMALTINEIQLVGGRKGGQKQEEKPAPKQETPAEEPFDDDIPF